MLATFRQDITSPAIPHNPGPPNPVIGRSPKGIPENLLGSVEHWFGEIARRRIRPGRFQSVAELIAAIGFEGGGTE